MSKKYWKSLEELNSSPKKDYLDDFEYVNRNEMEELLREESLSTRSSRRDFLKVFGYSIAASALAAGCEQPIHKAIPYLFQPEELVPGKAGYYATTCFDGDDYGSLLVKVRDGRPIKIEGNELVERGTSARLQASVLNLYDTARQDFPAENGNRTGWGEADKKIIAALDAASASGKRTVLLTGTIISPSTRRIITRFIEARPGTEWVSYDPISFSAMLEAHRLLFGIRALPRLYFDRADFVVGFGADFLGTWLNPVAFARQYADRRRLSGDEPRMSRHIQFEGSLSVTGSTADERIPVRPSEVRGILTYIYNRLNGIEPGAPPVQGGILDDIAAGLQQNAGRSLVVCGYNDVAAQSLVIAINQGLGNYGTTLDLNRRVNLRQGNDQAMEGLIEEMFRGSVGAIIIHNVNPVFDHPRGEDFGSGLQFVDLSISLAGSGDETSAICDFICPDSHYLESWGDAEPETGLFSLQQPAIRRLGDTRQMQESLMVWSGADPGYHEFLRDYWRQEIYPPSGSSETFDNFWTGSLQRGVVEISVAAQGQPSFNAPALSNILRLPATGTPGGRFEMEIIQNIAMGSGRHANNPWLQELPDPVSKICWDNYLAMAPSDAASLSLGTGDVVLLNGLIRLPVVVQPGQATGSVSAAMGYGRLVSGRVALGVGANVMPLAGINGGAISYTPVLSSLEKTGEKHRLASTQMHHSMEGRPIVRETTLEEYRSNPFAGNEVRQEILKHMYTLYDPLKYDGLHWGMSIDLNACTGCSACVTACQAENNIPVIGKEEVYRRRIMHWIRIDRYYSGDAGNPSVHFMPVLCQHCDHAPCENVCPVAATNQSNEGVNQMAYIRCVGTKYCINNCPYKVRRFNWFAYTKSDNFDFHMNNERGRLVLNPDVTVRERGIVEKCSFCIQRIQEAKITAKTENRVLREDEVLPACAQACPSRAITFGNLADGNSRVSRQFSTERNYHLLEELHTLPVVGYLTRVKNKKS
jgi:MoCo/4Fe-4S cofactor protein with predicted Tat translocation signal